MFEWREYRPPHTPRPIHADPEVELAHRLGELGGASSPSNPRWVLWGILILALTVLASAIAIAFAEEGEEVPDDGFTVTNVRELDVTLETGPAHCVIIQIDYGEGYGATCD
jgi:hypothetical protein